MCGLNGYCTFQVLNLNIKFDLFRSSFSLLLTAPALSFSCPTCPFSGNFSYKNVEYFDQCFCAPHSKHWAKYPFIKFFKPKS